MNQSKHRPAIAPLLLSSASETFEEQSIRTGHNLGRARESILCTIYIDVGHRFSMNHRLTKMLWGLYDMSDAVRGLKSVLDDVVCNTIPHEVDDVSGHGIKTRVTNVFYNLGRKTSCTLDYEKKCRPLPNTLTADGEENLWDAAKAYRDALGECQEYFNAHVTFSGIADLPDITRQFRKHVTALYKTLAKVEEYCKRVPLARELVRLDSRFPVFQQFPSCDELECSVKFHPLKMNPELEFGNQPEGCSCQADEPVSNENIHPEVENIS